MNTEKAFQKIEIYLVYALLFILPFTVLSISSNPFTVTKLAILSFFLILIALVKGARTIITGRFSFSSSAYDFPVILIAISYIASTIFRTPNKMEAILLPGTTTAIVGGAILYFLINQVKDKSVVVKLLVYSAAIYSLLTLLAFTGILAHIPQLPAFIRAKAYNPEGGYLPSMIFLLTVLPLSISTVLFDKDIKFKLISLIASLVVMAGLVLSLYEILPGKAFSPQFPNLNTSWAISIDSLKVSPLLGVGPGNYMTAFNRYRPITFNATPIWAVKYSTAGNYYFTLFTETGLLGLAGVLILLWAFVRDTKKQLKETKLVNWGLFSLTPILSFALIALLLFFFPATVFINVLFFILLALAAKSHSENINMTMQRVKEGSGEISTSRMLSILITVPLMAVFLYVGYREINILRGEYYYKAALEALIANDAQGTFSNMRNAVIANPNVDRYRATSSRVDLILADAIARKKDLTDNDRTTITQLIQASINDAKADVALNPLRAQNWEMLGRTYQSIIPLANGADNFALQAYTQAVALDPTNPQIRIELGGLYYSMKNYDTAARVLELAVASKNDLANGHFNLAYAYSAQGKIDQAIQQMTLVLGIVKPDTNDYDVAQKALADFQSKKKTTATTTPTASGESLTSPAAPTPALQPKVELPQGSEPPSAAVSGTPTPTPNPQPTTAQ